MNFLDRHKKDYDGKNRCGEICRSFEYFRTPGRLDFAIDFKNKSDKVSDLCKKCKYAGESNCFRQVVKSLTKLDQIDRIDTTIGSIK